MDNVTVNAKNQTAAALAAAAQSTGQKGQKAESTQFSSYLVFGTNNLNANMSMKTASAQNDSVKDQGSYRARDTSHNDDSDRSTKKTRKDDVSRDRKDDHDYDRKDDTRTTRSDDDRKDVSRQDRDDTQRDDAPRQDSAKDDRSSDDQAPKEQAKSDDGAEDQTNTDQAATTDDVSDEAASGAFAENAVVGAKAIIDPAVIALADPSKTAAKGTQKVEGTQAIQNIGDQGDEAQGPRTPGLKMGDGENKGEQKTQTQAATNNQQNTAPQLEGQMSAETARQADDLSKKIGNAQKANVAVKVTNEQANTASQATQNLSNAVEVATATTDTPKAEKQAGPQQANTANLGQNAQAAALNGQAQNAQTAQNAQNQNFQSMLAESKVSAGSTKTAIIQQTQSVGTETVQTTQTTTTQQTQQTQLASQAKQAEQQKPPVHTTAKPEEISVEITKAAKAGEDRINIQLKPLELGRIQVQLDMSSGKVVATITAERPETLNMLKNDAGDLQKSLQDAGLNMGEMNFNLQQQKGEGQQNAGAANAGAGDGGPNAGPEEELLLASQMDMLSQRASERAARGGVDISA